MKLRRISVAVAVATSVALIIGVQTATAADLGNTPLVESTPNDVELMSVMPAGGESIIPSAVHAAVSAIETGELAASANSFAWDESSSTLSVYVYGDSSPVVTYLAAALPEEQKVNIIPAARSRDSLETFIEGLADDQGKLPTGDLLAFAAPSPDGTSIRIGVAATEPGISSRQLEATMPTLDGIDLVFEASSLAEPVIRTRTSAPVYTGGVMAGQGKRCTTGFPVIRSDGEYGNLTADHCGEATEAVWRWGSSSGSVTVGTTSGQAGGDSDFEVFRGTSAPSGYSLVGAYNVSNSITPIRGYFSAISGDKICYNGSFSGTVCGNTVVGTNEYVCYEGIQCYWLARSTNDNGTPAAGSGDSGGPVMAFALGTNGTLGGYGTGIISGIRGGTTTCTGEPGVAGETGRKCSAEVLFAPVARFINNNLFYSMVTGPQT